MCLQGHCSNVCFGHCLSSPFPLIQSSLFQNICSCFVDMMSPKDFFVSLKILLIPYMNSTFFTLFSYLCTRGAHWHHGTCVGQRTTCQRHIFPSTMQILGISLRTGLPSTQPAMPCPKPQVGLCSWHTWSWGYSWYVVGSACLLCTAPFQYYRTGYGVHSCNPSSGQWKQGVRSSRPP